MILCTHFNVSLEMFSIETCQKFLARRGGEASNRQLASLLDDIQYMTEMKRLESHPEEKSMHIVPISGLCVGRILRLESEMRTVVEVWGSKYPSVEESVLIEDSDSYSTSGVVFDEDENALVTQLQANLPVKDRLYRLVMYRGCFVGSEAVDYLMQQRPGWTRAVCTLAVSNLAKKGFVSPVVPGMPFVDGYEFYRFALSKSSAADSHPTGAVVSEEDSPEL